MNAILHFSLYTLDTYSVLGLPVLTENAFAFASEQFYMHLSLFYNSEITYLSLKGFVAPEQLKF
jgi:hypothetical protein